MKFLNSYIGKKWKSGGTGPEAYNCWGLVADIYKKHLGFDVPIIKANEYDKKILAETFRTHPENANWKAIEKREAGDFDLCLMGEHDIYHCGLWFTIDGGGVLHAAPRAGVIFQRFKHLPYSRKEFRKCKYLNRQSA